LVHGDSLLGKKTEYPVSYSPDLLQSVPRDEHRRSLGLGAELPFAGEDIWNAYELTWLDVKGKPCVATAEIRVPADSPNIIESKSMKLYLTSLSMNRYEDTGVVRTTIASDLSRAAGAGVGVQLIPLDAPVTFGSFPGDCIDDLDVECDSGAVDPELLRCANDGSVSEELHSHLLRSLCPVTDQPDSGSILIRYEGRPIDQGSLLRYLVSYRNHNDFHECCVERIFLDIKRQCGLEALTVYARYNRRGGIDINPFRSDFESTAENTRLVRQ
jgi:7-cyano-7-deazaguanine reductase